MRRQSHLLTALLLTFAIASASAQQRQQTPGQRPAEQSQQAQQAQQGQQGQQAQPAPQAQPAGQPSFVRADAPQPIMIPPQPRVAPGLPTVELAPLLQRVERASSKRFLVDGRVGPEIYLAGVEPNDVTYPVLLSILRANGYAAFESEGRVNIVHDADIRSSPTRVVQSDDASIPADEFVTRIITTTNVEAPFLVPVLRSLLPVSAHLAAMPGSKLIIVDRYANVQRITEVVRTLDVPQRN